MGKLEKEKTKRHNWDQIKDKQLCGQDRTETLCETGPESRWVLEFRNKQFPRSSTPIIGTDQHAWSQRLNPQLSTGGKEQGNLDIPREYWKHIFDALPRKQVLMR